MAASIPWRILRAQSEQGPLRVLDPMVGSGTTAVVARSLGHRAIGFDMDPLAILIATTWCADFDERSILSKAREVLARAERCQISQRDAYPLEADNDAKKFVRYWFDPQSRHELTALSRCIDRVRDEVAPIADHTAYTRKLR
jgi:hypothetical protein